MSYVTNDYISVLLTVYKTWQPIYNSPTASKQNNLSYTQPTMWLVQTKQPVLHSTNTLASANKTTCPTLNQQCG